MSFDDENIRLPDEVKRETLIYNYSNNYNNNYSNDFDKELEDALYQSIQLYENEMQKNEEFEQKIIHHHKQEIETRKENVKPILFELNRIKKFDPKINNIFEIIEPILDSYCGLEFEECQLDNQTYNTIFNGLTKTRINMEFLMSIIKCE